jgi:N-acetylglucosaminyl-diphospho-decaprenol L-rhamnosyltransferase
LTVLAAVVNYNAGEHLAACVTSLRAEGVHPIVVVDNGSTDDSLDRLSDGPDITVIRSPSNVGYGGGMNRAVAAMGDDDSPVLVCNPDLVVRPGAIKVLVAALEADPKVGIVGPRLNNVDGSLYPSARAFPAMGDAIGHAFLGAVAPRNRFSQRYKLLDWDHATARPVDWVSGACCLVRRTAWDEVGGFDDSFFMYMEDVDLCWRVGRRGWQVLYEPAAEVMHVQGASTDQLAYRMIIAHHRSMLKFAARTSTGVSRVLLPITAAGIAVRAALACFHKWREDRSARPGGAGAPRD